VLNIRLVVQFAISDPASYLFRTADVSTLVGNAARGALAQVVAGRRVDDLLTTEKVAVQERVQTLAEATVRRYECGVTVLRGGARRESSRRTKWSKHSVSWQAARADGESHRARGGELRPTASLPVARGDAAKSGQEALAYNTQVVNRAVGESARFSGLATEYAKAPRETSTRLYLETIDEVLPKLDKTIVGADPKSVDLQFVNKK